jgi:hypothetical protein
MKQADHGRRNSACLITFKRMTRALSPSADIKSLRLESSNWAGKLRHSGRMTVHSSTRPLTRQLPSAQHQTRLCRGCRPTQRERRLPSVRKESRRSLDVAFRISRGYSFFIFVVLWAICLWNRVSLIKLLNYLREELLIIIGTSSSEPALPGLLRKLEAMGCSRTVSGLVPAGYSFNLDGTSIYLTVSALFLAQTTGTHLTGGQEALIAAPPYGELQRLCCSGWGKLHHTCATLKALGSVPVASIALLLGIDRIMSHCRSITNLIGNAVATITIARSENEFDRVLADRILSRPHSEEDSITV